MILTIDKGQRPAQANLDFTDSIRPWEATTATPLVCHRRGRGRGTAQVAAPTRPLPGPHLEMAPRAPSVGLAASITTFRLGWLTAQL